MMMVNHPNNNPVPWPTTVPEQMPWLSSSSSTTPCATGDPVPPMQFVGQTFEPDQHTTSRVHPIMMQQQQIPATSTNLNLSTVILPHQQVPTTIISNNPFDPQQLCSINNNNNSHISNQLNLSARLGPHAQLNSPPNFRASLTHIPHPIVQPSTPITAYHSHHSNAQHKRSSIEMEDELTTQEAPPTKQQLSENKLFDRFGSLKLDGERLQAVDIDLVDTDQANDDVDVDDSQPMAKTMSANDREEFNRYVYLLFKDKNSDSGFPSTSNSAVERLIREEREKLSKAVILWNPPPKNFVTEVSSDDDDEDFTYKDHRDFLKKPVSNDSSVVIEEIEEDKPVIVQTSQDDVMIE